MPTPIETFFTRHAKPSLRLQVHKGKLYQKLDVIYSDSQSPLALYSMYDVTQNNFVPSSTSMARPIQLLILFGALAIYLDTLEPMT